MPSSATRSAMRVPLYPLCAKLRVAAREDGLPRLLVAAGDEVHIVLARRLEAPGQASPHGGRPQALGLERLDVPEQREVVLGVEGAGAARLLRLRQQAEADVVVDGAPRHTALALELADGQRTHDALSLRPGSRRDTGQCYN